MPIFELDAGRPVLVEPMQPAAGTFPTDSASVVANHLGSLLGEHLFPVSTRQQRGDGPHLLAVDAAGQPIVVEVVSTLDAEALVRALRYAGAAARLTSADLARSYHAGPEKFATELVAFRENVPVAAVHAAARHAGARLLLVCSEVAEAAVDAVEFLRQSGRQVQVLQVGVLQGSDGRRYVDVSPMVPQTPARRAVEPAVFEPLPEPGPVAHRHAGPARAEPASHIDRMRDTASTPPVPAEPPEAAATGPIPSAGAAAPVGTFPFVLPVPVGPAAGVPLSPDPVLVALAADLATATTLVWARRRRGQRLVATLRLDGLLQLPDGAVFADPDAAAAAASDSEYATDGWRVWRLGDDGPTLGDVRAS
ncbi:restriction system modified-DNA reader domain-containing protein [Pengzhenrongella sicca]|uniref:RAMA domain-containing protein n=1 Tax=Pengzhenrongella sicca TaxID=2819238 RepID=A0A8A4ZCY9_9MICO|nr:hypothetical protein [Pengzhenrongella sicca]QTE29774.1 hypothetical protein J4E96_01640 [Pengzhenrongella sicca]